MLKTRLQFYGVFFFALLFVIIFWKEKLALNLVLFGSLMGGFIFYLNPQSFQRTNVRLTAFGTMLAGLFVLMHASGPAQTAFILSFFAMTGFVYQPRLRLLPFTLMATIANFFTGPITLLENNRKNHKLNRPQKRIFYFLKLSLIPLAICLVFFILFSLANPKFADLFRGILERFVNWVFRFLLNWSPGQFFMFILGLAISSGLLYSRHYKGLGEIDANSRDQLVRERSNSSGAFQTLGLKTEYRIGLLVVISVNLLTLLNNVMDINWLWINFEPDSVLSYRQMVHEGTYLLILSILIAMSVMFFFFRRNINFLKKNKLLKILSYVWILQNVVMVFSVVLRNYHYIAKMGLAYKRIGVFFFLALTLFGLIVLFLKIKNKNSIYQVIRINSWATYAMLLLLAVVNWDSSIAHYNLNQQHGQGLDVEFLLNLSGKALPEIDAQKDQLAGLVYQNGWFEYTDAGEGLSRKIEEFKTRQSNRSWLSWNFADARALSYFTNRNK